MMSQEPAAAPVRRAVFALGVVAVAGVLLIGYTVWALATVPERTNLLDVALTPADRRLMVGDLGAFARTVRAFLPFQLALGIVALVVSLTAIPLRLGYDWGRVALWWATPPVALGAFTLMIGSDDLNSSRLFHLSGDVKLSAAAADAFHSLLPPGLLGVGYLSLAIVALLLPVACFLLMHRDAHWFLTRGRRTDASPR